MADIRTEPRSLLKLRMENKLMEHQLTLQRQAVRRAEIQFELDKISDNDTAVTKVIEDLKKELASFKD